MGKKDEKEKKNSTWLGFLLLLLIFAFVLYFLISGMLTFSNFMIVTFLLALMAIPLVIQNKKKTGEINEESTRNEFDKKNDDTYNTETPIEISEASGSTSKPEVKKPKSADVAKIIPLFVLIFVFVFVFIGNPFDAIFGANPEGRWYYYMELDGHNLTEYWYMDLEEGGTLEIGIKNQGFAEDPEGSGTWYLENGVLYIFIDYDYSGFVDQNLQLEIKGDKLYELNGTYTGYEKE